MRVLKDFLGAWRLHRRIVDRRMGETGRFTGRVLFTSIEDGAMQEEEGTLTLPGRPPMTATRTYLWSEAAGRLVLSFSDGRPFHDFDAAAPAPEAVHPCGDDLYQVRYDFRRWPRWRAVWHVTGPRKDHVIISALAPLAPKAATRHNPSNDSME